MRGLSYGRTGCWDLLFDHTVSKYRFIEDRAESSTRAETGEGRQDHRMIEMRDFRSRASDQRIFHMQGLAAPAPESRNVTEEQ